MSDSTSNIPGYSDKSYEGYLAEQSAKDPDFFEKEVAHQTRMLTFPLPHGRDKTEARMKVLQRLGHAPRDIAEPEAIAPAPVDRAKLATDAEARRKRDESEAEERELAAKARAFAEQKNREERETRRNQDFARRRWGR